MIERDAHRFWKDKGVTGAGLREQLLDVVNQLQKAKDKKLREFIALSTSLLKSICYESGIKWSAMGLNEHRYIDFISDPVNVIRAEPPPPEPPKAEGPVTGDLDPKILEKNFKKAELATALAEMQKSFVALQQQVNEEHPDPEDEEPTAGDINTDDPPEKTSTS